MFALTGKRQKESDAKRGNGRVIEYHLWIGTTLYTVYTEKLMKMSMTKEERCEEAGAATGQRQHGSMASFALC